MNEKVEQGSEYQEPAAFACRAQGHDFTFYPRGQDRLQALTDHIQSAQKSLNLFYYMFQADTSGIQIRDALVDAAQRGVHVHLIVDAFGTDAEAEFFQPIVDAGGIFSQFSSRWNVRFLIRNHQKYVIADSARVFTGGSNISDHYFAPSSENGWCDLGVSIEGPVVERFEAWFAAISGWVESDKSKLRALRKIIRDWEPRACEGGNVDLLVGGPSIRLYGWALALRGDLRDARHTDLISAYFTPPRSLLRLLRRVAGKGKLRLITAGKSDIDATISAARLLYRRLLKAGAHIAEFQPSKLHMKLLVVDQASYFGSANMDKRSWRINVELMVRVEDAELANRLRGFIDHLEDASDPVTPHWYREKSSGLASLRWRIANAIAVFDYWLSRNLNR